MGQITAKQLRYYAELWKATSAIYSYADNEWLEGISHGTIYNIDHDGFPCDQRSERIKGYTYRIRTESMIGMTMGVRRSRNTKITYLTLAEICKRYGENMAAILGEQSFKSLRIDFSDSIEICDQMTTYRRNRYGNIP